MAPGECSWGSGTARQGVGVGDPEDVTGVWSGTVRGSTGGRNFEITIDLKQEGQKVTGFLKWTAFSYSGLYDELPGPVEGTVSGDRFEFKRINGSFSGAMTVAGDEMTGQGQMSVGLGSIFLRRVDSSPRPSSPKS